MRVGGKENGELVAGTIRAFIAAPVPGEILKRIRDLQQELNPAGGGGVRWVRPEAIHLTFHFLGDIDSGKVSELDAVMGEAAGKIPPFRIRVRGLGAFPHLKRPRVFWVGLDAGEEIHTLHHQLGQGLKRLRYRVESRAFRPHLTLARVRSFDGLGPLIREFTNGREREFGEGEIREVVLYRSELKPGGAEYTSLRTQFFQGAETTGSGGNP